MAMYVHTNKGDYKVATVKIESASGPLHVIEAGEPMIFFYSNVPNPPSSGNYPHTEEVFAVLSNGAKVLYGKGGNYNGSKWTSNFGFLYTTTPKDGYGVYGYDHRASAGSPSSWYWGCLIFLYFTEDTWQSPGKLGYYFISGTKDASTEEEVIEIVNKDCPWMVAGTYTYSSTNSYCYPNNHYANSTVIANTFFAGAVSGTPAFWEDNSDTDGGDGDYDGTSDSITVPTTPLLNAVATGFINIFNPNLTQLNSLASFMWDGNILDSLIKIFANPMDVILGLSILPCSIPNSGAKEVKVGNISTGIEMFQATSQVVIVDCGTVTIAKYWGSALDYSPFTKAQLYLPYVGYKDINIDEIMGKDVNIVYHVDILSGSCVAFIKVDGCVLYQFNGQCSQQIPITGSDMSKIIATAASLVVGVGIAVATGGAGAPAAGAMLGEATAATALTMPTSVTGVAALASSSVATVMNSKPTFERSGNLAGMAGQLGCQKPYFIITRPRQSLPTDYNKIEGFPSNITSRLGDLNGFTQVEKIHLKNMTSTMSETNEIYRLLGEGVII